MWSESRVIHQLPLKFRPYYRSSSHGSLPVRPLYIICTKNKRIAFSSYGWRVTRGKRGCNVVSVTQMDITLESACTFSTTCSKNYAFGPYRHQVCIYPICYVLVNHPMGVSICCIITLTRRYRIKYV